MALLKSFLVGLVLFPAIAAAQVPDSVENAVQKELEVVLEELDEDADADSEQLIQFLQDLAANPLDINTAGIEELMQIPGISLRAATAIVTWRTKNGRIQSLNELEKIKGISPSLLKRIQPYVAVNESKKRPAVNWKRLAAAPQVELMSRYRTVLDAQDGYVSTDTTQTGYLGNQAQQYQRITVSGKHFSVNLTQETDPGEPANQPFSPDFRSMHVALANVGPLKTLVAGDFTAGFGQGLAMFSGGAFGKGREVIGAGNRGERGIKPYRSAEENRFFRGVAFETEGKLSFSGFISSRKWSASPSGDSAFSYPSLTGLYRTESELSRRDNLGIYVAAGRIRFKGEKLRGGITGYAAEFSAPIVARTSPQNRYDFQGTKHHVFAADFRYTFFNVQLFGEAARSREGGLALYSGSEFYPNDETTVSLIYRNYQKNYVTLFGDAFSEGSGTPQNEEGLYAGVKHQLNAKISIAAYADQYRFPSARSSISRPSSGQDLLGTVDFTGKSGLAAYVLIRSETQEVQTSGTDAFGREINIFGNQTRRSIRLNGEFPMNRYFRWRTRIEAAHFQFPGKENTSGLLLYQDFRIMPARKWQFDTRLTWFDTQSFDARVYQFENDLLYVMSNTALSGRGRRFYVVGKWSPKPKLDIWAKFDITVYDDRDEVGSGLERVEGNARRRFGIQAIWTF